MSADIVGDPRRVEAERDALRAQVERVRALADPLGAWMQYAVQLDDDVILTVSLDDLRAALDAD